MVIGIDDNLLYLSINVFELTSKSISHHASCSVRTLLIESHYCPSFDFQRYGNH